MGASQSQPVLALGCDRLNSGEVGTVARNVTRKECQALCGRVSADGRTPRVVSKDSINA